MATSSDRPRRVLIIVENLPSPFDRRVWQEATTLRENGYEVSIICPTGKGYESKYDVIDGIHIHRHNLPLEGEGALGYLLEYSTALFWEFVLAWKVLLTRGFDVIHACNPPTALDPAIFTHLSYRPLMPFRVANSCEWGFKLLL